MAILSKGTDFTTGDQVTAAKLDALVDNATFASDAVDDSTTALDTNGKIIVKDGGITPAKLNLAGGTVTTGAFRAAQGVPNSADASTTGFAFSTDGDTGMFCTGTSGAAAGGDIAIFSNGAQRVTLDTSGKVGIGTTSPSSELEVVGDILIDNGGSDGGQLILASAGNNTMQIDNFSGNFRVSNTSTGTELLKVTSSGNIIIQNIPTSASGLASGTVYSDSGTLKIVS